MKRTRSDSAASAVKAIAKAARPLAEVPAHVQLRDRDRPFWRVILAARARDEWTEADLVVAAQMARCMSDIEHEQVLLDVEGSVIENDRGSAAINPRATLLDGLVRRQLAYARSLRMGGRVAGDSRDEATRRKTERHFDKVLAAFDDDDDGLLAR